MHIIIFGRQIQKKKLFAYYVRVEVTPKGADARFRAPSPKPNPRAYYVRVEVTPKGADAHFRAPSPEPNPRKNK